MRSLNLIVLLASLPLFARASDEGDAIAIVQKLFDGMFAHNAEMIRSTVTADSRFFYVRGDSAPMSTTAEDFITHISSMNGELLERFTSKPTVLIHGRMAQVWGQYEFLRDGKFVHCGIDSISLFRASDAWKIASIAYTAETKGCPGQ
jgi:hypothetical protein